MQGRDGAGACPCVGTGALFRRDALVSAGGQAVGSITEDFNTAMHLLSSGLATMYLNERLVFGLAPDDLADMFAQRLRWAAGALQILARCAARPAKSIEWGRAMRPGQALIDWSLPAPHWPCLLTAAAAFFAALPRSAAHKRTRLPAPGPTHCVCRG